MTNKPKLPSDPARMSAQALGTSTAAIVTKNNRGEVLLSIIGPGATVMLNDEQTNQLFSFLTFELQEPY